MSFSRILFLLLFLSAATLQAQWTRVTNLPFVSWNSWAIDAPDSTTLVFVAYAIETTGQSGKNLLVRTTDGGLTWLKSPAPSDAIHLSAKDKDHVWIAGTDLGIYYTPDGGQTWTKQFRDSMQTECLNYIEMFDMKNGIAQGDNMHTMFTDSSGITRQPGPTLILSTTDGGKNWTSINDVAFGGISGDIWKRLDFPTKDIGYFFTSGMNPQHLYKTQMGGAKWAELKNFTKSVQAMKFYSPELGLVMNSPEIYRTKDAGYTWETFTMPGKTGWGNDIEFIPGNPAKVWLTNGSALFFSGDTGKTFREISVVPALNSMYRMRDIAFPDKNHGWLFADAVLYKITNPESVTSVAETGNLSAADYRIAGNYPNPFNPSTVINYQLSGESKITLEVFDLTGQQVSVLAEGIRHAGSYSTSFNGSRFASGTYICRLKAIEISTGKLFISSVKMSLIK